MLDVPFRLRSMWVAHGVQATQFGALAEAPPEGSHYAAPSPATPARRRVALLHVMLSITLLGHGVHHVLELPLDPSYEPTISGVGEGVPYNFLSAEPEWTTSNLMKCCQLVLPISLSAQHIGAVLFRVKKLLVT
eukprot:6177858-Pleurochrysis_carterae.AAC.5